MANDRHKKEQRKRERLVNNIFYINCQSLQTDGSTTRASFYGDVEGIYSFTVKARTAMGDGPSSEKLNIVPSATKGSFHFSSSVCVSVLVFLLCMMLFLNFISYFEQTQMNMHIPPNIHTITYHFLSIVDTIYTRVRVCKRT
jgi:hypothetical protein